MKNSEVAAPGSCRARGFRALLYTQYCGALNDNLYRIVVGLILVDLLASQGQSGGSLAVMNVVFVLPFLLLSSYTGYLADRYSKSLIMRSAKVAELAAMLLGLWCFVTQSVWGLLAVLFVMGAHTALFSPSKYGVLPEILPEEEISRGNGYIEFWTFAGIISGTVLGGIVKTLSPESYLLPGIAVVVVAVIGLIFSFSITRTEPSGTHDRFDPNPFAFIHTAKEMRGNHSLFLVVLGIAYFWAVGALYQLNILLYAKELMGLSDFSTAVLVTVLGIGVGVGSVTAGVVSEGKVEMGLVPVGGAFLSLGSLFLLGSSGSFLFTALWLFVVGLGSGFFIVPLNAYLQEESPAQARGRYIATGNVMSYFAMLVSSVFFWLCVEILGMGPRWIFFIVGVLSVGVAVYLAMLIPGMLLRCVNWILAHSLYRLRVVGAANVPASGGALLVSNHVSYADAALLLASIGRPIRFLMYRPIYEAPFIKPFAKAVQSIPIAPEDGPKGVVKALAVAREAIEAGELVCIFAEGSLTRIGHLLPFQKGFERIMKDVDAPIIPVFLDQIWGSIFSYRDGRFLWKLPKQIPYPVTAHFGKPLPGGAKTHEVRQSVEELSAYAARERTEDVQVLPRSFIAVAKRRLFRRCIVDSSGKSLNYLQTLAASLFLSRVLRSRYSEKTFVGILLPSSVGGVLANLASFFAGLVPVNLNFTAGADAITAAKRQAHIASVITSRIFLEKISFETEPDMVFLEDLLAEFSQQKRVLYGLCAALIPRALLMQAFLPRHLQRDDLATVIFSSGSTAEPKGVMLSHGNIASNIEALYDVFQVNRNDAVIGVLPFFHSFGFTGTLWFPLLAGIRAVYHPNPTEGAVVGELVEKHRATLMMSTPTFLLSYIRKCSKEQFQTLRAVVTGAEKLKDNVGEAFEKKFGIAPMEGYGCTELSPVAMLNVEDVKEGSIHQVGHKPGTVGHPLPGIAAKIVDPDSFELLAPQHEGLLLISGPNVMLGYLGNDEKTREVIRDGWYVTGDIAKKDEEGFITITDRVARFSKIGGEMVPHGKVEEAIVIAIDNPQIQIAVTSVPDDRKGEKLVVLVAGSIDVPAVLEKLKTEKLPNLWIPKSDAFFAVAEIPLLGSGKVDLKAVKQRAKDLAAEK